MQSPKVLLLSFNRKYSVILSVILLVFLGMLAVRSAVRLETHWDTFSYHIPFAAKRAGIDLPLDFNNYISGFFQGLPPLPHLIQGGLWRLTGSMNATGVVNFLAFTGFLIFCVSILKASFSVVCLLCLTTPLILIHLTSSYVDLFSNVFLSIGILSLIRMFCFREWNSHLLFYCGLFGLLVTCWSKFQLVILACLLFLVYLVCFSFADVQQRRKKILIILFIGLLAAIPYLKNYIYYSNPFWPVEIPFFSEYFPYNYDVEDMGLDQKPPPLKHLGNFELFIHSLFEINHPKSYPNRERWIIDQGSAWLSHRMGGFWNTAVIAMLISFSAFALIVKGKKGAILIVAFMILLCFIAILPQSHELRYYLMIPLVLSAIIAMFFPLFNQRFPGFALLVLVIFVVMFAHVTKVNKGYYKIEQIGYQEAAEDWLMTPWWSKLVPEKSYCAVDFVLAQNFFLTGPGHAENQIYVRDQAELCPDGVEVIRGGNS